MSDRIKTNSINLGSDVIEMKELKKVKVITNEEGLGISPTSSIIYYGDMERFEWIRQVAINTGIKLGVYVFEEAPSYYRHSPFGTVAITPEKKVCRGQISIDPNCIVEAGEVEHPEYYVKEFSDVEKAYLELANEIVEAVKEAKTKRSGLKADTVKRYK